MGGVGGGRDNGGSTEMVETAEMAQEVVEKAGVAQEVVETTGMM